MSWYKYSIFILTASPLSMVLSNMLNIGRVSRHLESICGEGDKWGRRRYRLELYLFTIILYSTFITYKPKHHVLSVNDVIIEVIFLSISFFLIFAKKCVSNIKPWIVYIQRSPCWSSLPLFCFWKELCIDETFFLFVVFDKVAPYLFLTPQKVLVAYKIKTDFFS